MSGPWEKYQAAPSGGPWAKYGTQAQAFEPPPPIPEVPLPRVPSTAERVARTADDIVRSLAQGATFGFADEIAASGDAALAAITGQEYGPEYERRLASQRLRDREIDPAIAIPGQVVGGIGTTVAAAPYVPIKAAATGLGRLAQTTAGGAGLGGLAGAGMGESPEERAAGALMGATIGAAVPVVLKGAGALIPRRAAPRRLEATLRQSGMTPAEAQAQMQALGPNAVLADVSDATRQQLQSAVSRAPAQVGRVAQQLEGRVAAAPERLTEYIGRLAGGRNFRSTIDDMTAAQRSAARPLYERAAQEVPVFRSPEVTQAIKNPRVRAALDAARKDLGVRGKVQDFNLPHDVVDLTYKYLGDRAAKAARQGASFKSRGINDARVALRDAITRESPTYGRALDAFSGPAQLKNLAVAGSKFWNQSADDVQSAVGKLTSQSERDAYLLGVTKAIQDQISKGTYGSDLSRRLAGTPAKQAALRSVFPDEEGFNNFMRQLLSEGEFARTRNVVLGGSQTQPRLSAADEMGSMATESVLTGSPVPWMTRATRRVFSGDLSPRQARDLTNLLLSRGNVEDVITSARPSGGLPVGVGAGLGGVSERLSGLR